MALHPYGNNSVEDRTDPDTQKVISNITFEELVTGENGVAVSRSLVNAIIDQQIGQQIGVSCPLLITGFILNPSQVDTISDVLQARCGSFCSTNDVMLYKVLESLLRVFD